FVHQCLFDLNLVGIPLSDFLIQAQKRDIYDVFWIVSTPAGQSNRGSLIDVSWIVMKSFGTARQGDASIIIERIIVIGIADLNKRLIDWIRHLVIAEIDVRRRGHLNLFEELADIDD